MIAVPADHRLADTDEPVDVSVLADEHVLLLEDGHCLRDIRLLRCTAPVPQRRIAMLWRESSVYRDFLPKVAEVARDLPPRGSCTSPTPTILASCRGRIA